ncbi:hypothetical protein PENSPDRAFT_755483 [Peniophora sp. CONT]|nr:hypothetical protein PENSPDRAFT_755483 [Peniophora sp. CONT]
MLVHSLPADILCAIFAALKEIHPTRQTVQSHAGTKRDAHLQRLGWLVVTFVNQRWRSVALDYAALWSDLCIHLGPEWLQIFVSRSKDSALTYDDMGAGSRDKTLLARHDACTSVLPTHMHRMRMIRLHTASQRLVQAALAPPAPVLESLTIFGDLSMSVPIFAGQVPRLRSLTLGAYPRQAGSLLRLDAQPGILHGLTSLQLNIYGDEPPVTILGILRHTKRLEALSLVVRSASTAIIPAIIHPDHMDGQPAALPALKTCTLDGRIDGVAHLVSHLIIPISVAMTILCESSSFLPSDSTVLRQLLDGLAAWRWGYGNGPSAPFRVARLESDPNGTATLKLATHSAVEALSPFVLPPDNYFTLSLKQSLRGHDRDFTQPTIYSDILPTLFSEGEALHVCAEGTYGTILRQHLRCRLPDLKHICSSLFGHNVIGPDLDPFPSLQVMHLINPSSFNYAEMERFTTASEPERTSPCYNWHCLRSNLQERRSAGLILERIVIYQDISGFMRRESDPALQPYQVPAPHGMMPQWLSDRYTTVKAFMEDVIEIETVQTTEPFWKA